MDAGKVNIWVCTAWHPSQQQPINGTFVQEQVEIVHDYLGDRAQLTVLNPFMPLDLKALLLQGKKPFYDEWYYSGRDVKVYQYQGKLFWHRFPFDIHLSNRFYLRRMLKKIIPERGVPDRFWAVTLSGAFLAHTINQIMGWQVPILLQEHSNPLAMHLRFSWQKKMWSRVKNSIGRVIVVAQRQIDEFKEVGYLGSLQVIPNPVNSFFIRFVSNAFKDKVVITSIGYLDKPKDPHKQIAAARLLKDAGIQFEWHWIGDGRLRSNCEDLVEKYGLNDFFFFHGNLDREKVLNELLKANIFVLSSAYENCPVALIEAQCVGLPCIVHCNGASEKILLPENGVAIDMDEDGEALKSAVLEMANKKWNNEEIKSRSLEVFHPATFAKQMRVLLSLT
jgi:glycosyltransferase involved in cell wall biosynthesis